MSSAVWGHDDFYLKEAQPQQYLVLYIINHNNDETNLVANLLGACGPLRDAHTRRTQSGQRVGSGLLPPSSRGLQTPAEGSAHSHAPVQPHPRHSPASPHTLAHTALSPGPSGEQGSTSTLLWARGRRDSPLLLCHPKGKRSLSSPHQP